MAEWISVKDRLPPSGFFVLMVAGGQVLPGCYGGNGGSADRFTFVGCTYEPTHWQPWPSPPPMEGHGQ